MSNDEKPECGCDCDLPIPYVLTELALEALAELDAVETGEPRPFDRELDALPFGRFECDPTLTLELFAEDPYVGRFD